MLVNLARGAQSMLGNRLLQGMVRLLKNLFRMSRDTLADSSRHLLSDVQSSEALSSFVIRTEQVVKRTNTIHHSRLMPRRKDKKKDARLETSVCRSHLLSDLQV